MLSVAQSQLFFDVRQSLCWGVILATAEGVRARRVCVLVRLSLRPSGSPIESVFVSRFISCAVAVAS